MMRTSAIVFATLLSAGCTGTDHLDVTTVLAHGNCQTSDAGVKEIDYATLAAYRGTRLLDMTESKESVAHPVHLVAILPGEFPTPGYGLAVGGEPKLQQHVLTIAVTVSKPASDAILAQMITRPCLVVGIGDPRVERVRVVDDSARTIGEIELAPAKTP
ncbi:MAG TPA: protease complex subunit PrcB family protein [Pseudomonadales bacterium]|nr:protease complex subunit PrcB family protein [Pseudomonadales bacterium]